MTKYVDKFKNPANNYVETATTPFSFLLCMLFGPLYFLMKGNFKHSLLSLILMVMTAGVSNFIYPFGVYVINKEYYMKRGWIAV
ncbi:hypothetical protein [Dyadobacter sp. 32]|uniref:hypothetical protein n=1 Tax=Dyadobacter sp. 32 TaxID=538966 RepID=UPI0011EDE088